MLNKKFARHMATALAAVFCGGLFAYIYERLNPALYHIAQEPVFQANQRFFAEFLSYPGGLADYCAAFLTQFFLQPAVGASLIAVLLFVVCYGTLLMLRSTGGNRPWYSAHLLPAALCMPMLGNYHHPFAITIAYAAAIWSFVLFAAFGKRATWSRILVFALVAGALYYAAGGAMLLFALLGILYEAALHRRWLIATACGALAAAIPFFAFKFLFLISLSDAYFHLLPIGIALYNPPEMAAAPYAVLPVLMFLPAVLDKLNARSRKAMAVAVPVLVLGGALAVTAAVSFNRAEHDSLTLYLLTRDGDWEGILKEAGDSKLDNRVSGFAIGRALCGTGRLGTELFAWPQKYTDRALFLFGPQGQTDLGAFNFPYRCDLFFDLGLVNEAEQWGYEALTINGETPQVLERLAQIHAIKGEFAAARTCLAVLETVPGHSGWARAFRQKLADASLLAADSVLQPVRISMPTTDYLRNSTRQPDIDLAKAIHQNPRNKKAFDYLMASFMLQGNLQAVAWLSGYLPQFYTDVPRLYGEALVIMKAVGAPGLPAAADRIDQKTFSDYMEFNQTIRNHGGDYRAAESEILTWFPISYWHYFFYQLMLKDTAR